MSEKVSERACVERSAQFRIEKILNSDVGESVLRLVTPSEENPQAAVLYEKKKWSIFVSNIGSVIRGRGRALLAQLAHEALAEGRDSIYLYPSSKKTENYYIGLGFTVEYEEGVGYTCYLEGENLQQLASEYERR